MKKFALILILNSQFLILNSAAQSPTWLWAKTASGASSENSYAVASDSGGNVIIAGKFYVTTFSIGSYTLTNANGGTADFFVAKYDAAGNVIWASSGGGTDYDDITDIATDVAGNVFVTGYYSGTSIILGNDTLTTSGS